MTVVLLCGAGLLAQTMLALNRTDNGIDKHDVLTMEVALPAARYTDERRMQFYQEAVQSLRRYPASATRRPPTAWPWSGCRAAARSSISSARRRRR